MADNIEGNGTSRDIRSLSKFLIPRFLGAHKRFPRCGHGFRTTVKHFPSNYRGIRTFARSSAKSCQGLLGEHKGRPGRPTRAMQIILHNSNEIYAALSRPTRLTITLHSRFTLGPSLSSGGGFPDVLVIAVLYNVLTRGLPIKLRFGNARTRRR